MIAAPPPEPPATASAVVEVAERRPPPRPSGPTFSRAEVVPIGGIGPLGTDEARGKPFVVIFCATFAAPCSQLLRDAQRVADNRAGRVGMVAVFVDEDDDPSVDQTIRSYALGLSLRIAFARDRKGGLVQRFRVDAIPSTYVLDQEGNVVRTLKGAAPGDFASALEAALPK
jgi:hypothetical protein